MRLQIEVEVDIDPTLVDPHEVAEAVVEEYNTTARHNPPMPHVRFLDAAWGPNYA